MGWLWQRGPSLATAAKWESGRNQKGSLSVNLCRLRLPAIEAETVRASSARTEIRTQDRPKQKKKGSLSDSHCRLWFQGSYPQTVRASKPALRFELRTSILLGWRSNQLSYTGGQTNRRRTIGRDLFATFSILDFCRSILAGSSAQAGPMHGTTPDRSGCTATETRSAAL